MVVYRSPMEKILEQNEDDTVITNASEPGKTFWRKLKYRWSIWKSQWQKMFGRSQ